MSEKITAYHQIWKHHVNKDYKDHREEWKTVSSLGKLPENKDKTYGELEEMVSELNSGLKVIPAQRSLKADLVEYHMTMTKLPKSVVEVCYVYAVDMCFPDDVADIQEEMIDLIVFAEAVASKVRGGEVND